MSSAPMHGATPTVRVACGTGWTVPFFRVLSDGSARSVSSALARSPPLVSASCQRTGRSRKNSGSSAAPVLGPVDQSLQQHQATSPGIAGPVIPVLGTCSTPRSSRAWNQSNRTGGPWWMRCSMSPRSSFSGRAGVSSGSLK